MKYFKWIATTVFSVAALNASASTISSDTISDNYVGAGYWDDVKGYERYWDVDSMKVTREHADNGTVTLTVDILTSFYNDINRSGIVLGDLFMSTEKGANGQVWNPNGSQADNFSSDRFSNDSSSNTGTIWNYAYNINDADRDNINFANGSQHVTGSGAGKLVTSGNQRFNANDIVDSNSDSNRHNQAVYLRNSGSYTTINNAGGWNNNGYQTTMYNNDSHWYGNLTFTMDVSGTALATANQIAFRWAMSCANDVIEGLAQLKSPSGDTTTVPEPQALLLMLLGLGGIAYRRKTMK